MVPPAGRQQLGPGPVALGGPLRGAPVPGGADHLRGLGLDQFLPPCAWEHWPYALEHDREYWNPFHEVPWMNILRKPVRGRLESSGSTRRDDEALPNWWVVTDNDEGKGWSNTSARA